MKYDADTLHLFASKIALVLSTISKTSSPEDDKNASEALLNIIKSMTLLEKIEQEAQNDER